MIAVFVGIIFLRLMMRKGVTAAAKVLNKNVIYKNEYQVERQLISEKIIFDTRVSAEKIMEQIRLTVEPVTELHLIKPNFYEHTKRGNMVAYSYQNKNYERFVAIVEFDKVGEFTRGTFRFLRWKEDSGMLLSADYMKLLRKKIWTAFETLDEVVKVSIVEAS